MERKKTVQLSSKYAVCAFVKLFIILPIGLGEEFCGLGQGNDYSPWIANEYGRLRFPIYNQDVYGVTEDVDVQTVCEDTLQQQISSGYNESKNKTCQFDISTRKSICKGEIDPMFVRALKHVKILIFVVDSYRMVNAYHSVSTSLVHEYGSQVVIPDDVFKLTGDIYSQDIGIGMRASVSLKPNIFYNGFQVSGDAFSNDLRVGWRVQGEVMINDFDGVMSLSTNISTTESGWQLIGNLSSLPPANPSVDGLLKPTTHILTNWTLHGYLDAEFLPTRLNIEGGLVAEENKGWLAYGKAQVKPLLITWAVDASVTPSLSEQITIPRDLFSNINITHLVFKDSYFMGDFDKDALTNIVDLKTINFLNSKLEEVPRLDYLFNNLTTLEAIYIEDTSMPNVVFGDSPSLQNLQLISFKGSGPLQLDSDSFLWLSQSNLTYMNLQDCNIKIDPNTDAVLLPVSKTLKYLDLSYTSLTDEKSIAQIVRNLSLTHLSLAGLQLSTVPTSALEQTNHSLEYLTLRGNNFRKVPEENMFSMILDFPDMPNLLELDLMRCGINFIETGAFDKLPKLKKLFLSYNNVANINEGWYNIKPGIKYIDLSWNGASVIMEPTTTFTIKESDGLSSFENLEIADFSNGVFEYPDSFAASLQSPVLGVSFCNTNLKNISGILRHNFTQLIVLDISNNPTIVFGSDETLNFLHSLQSLQYLYAKNNKITNTMLANIQEFSSAVKARVFMESLKFMDLSGNNIKSLTAECFRYFPKLEYIDLTGNSITSWSTPILTFSRNLYVLKISDNKIERITDAMQEDFYNLHELEIGRNPFNCDCFVEKFTTRLLKSHDDTLCAPRNFSNIILGKKGQSYFKLSMNHPRIKRDSSSQSLGNLVHVQDIQRKNPSRKCIESIFGDVISSIKDKCVKIADWDNSNNYYCYTQDKETLALFKNEIHSDLCVVPVVQDLTTEEPANMSVIYIGIAIMIVLGIVVGVIYWKWWDIRLLTRAVRNAAVLAFMDKEDGQVLLPYQYCAFISYSDKDRPWVLDQLLPHLEAWNNLKVCLHERDFQVGTSIMENITYCMDRSKNIVLILSKSYLKSQWCQFEMHLAQHRLLETKRDDLILILLEPIPSYKTPKTLKYLLRTKTYIQWPVSADENEQVNFWTRLFKALSSSAGQLMPV